MRKERQWWNAFRKRIISVIACNSNENHHSFFHGGWDDERGSRVCLTRSVFDLLIRIRQIIIFIFVLMIKRPGKVLCQMYAHIYGRKHAQYLCSVRIHWLTNHIDLTIWCLITHGKMTLNEWPRRLEKKVTIFRIVSLRTFLKIVSLIIWYRK